MIILQTISGSTTDKQADRQTDGQTDGWIDRQSGEAHSAANTLDMQSKAYYMA